MMCQADHYARRSDLFNQGRICKYYGVNMDTTDLESLKFLHGKCWQEYRKNGEVYPFPLFSNSANIFKPLSLCVVAVFNICN